MPIDPIRDSLLPLSTLVRHLPNAPSPATLWRWHKRGILGIRLEIIRIGGRVYSTDAALADFIRATTEARAEADNAQSEARPPATEDRLRNAGLLDD